MKTEYREGPEAKEAFEESMKAIFQAPKQPLEKLKGKAVKPSTLRKPKSSDKD